MNQGIHLVDLLVWFMGEPVRTSAFAATTTATGSPHRLELDGTHGAIQVEGEHAQVWQLRDPEAAVIEPPPLRRDTDAGAAGDPRGIRLDGHARIIADFVRAVRDGRRPAIDGAEGLRSLAAIESIDRAASPDAGAGHAPNAPRRDREDEPWPPTDATA